MLHDIPRLDQVAKRDDMRIVAELAGLPFDFFLAGSRYMQCATEKSDWDFYAQYSPELIQSLEAADFESTDPCNYRGDWQDSSGQQTVDVFARGAVHVQVLNHVGLMRRVRDFIRDKRLHEHISAEKGPARRIIWNAVIEKVQREMQDEAEASGVALE